MKKLLPALMCAAALGAAQAADIVLDAGHGGKDPGAIGTLGKARYYEKDIALDVSRQLRSQLQQQGFSVAMTRSDDTFRPLKNRLAYARKHCRKLFASVHVNAAKNGRAHGVHTYVSRKAHLSAVGQKSLKIAENVQKAFNPKSPAVRRAGFMMLKNTNCPSVQLEMYYMSHKGDLKKLADKNGRRAIAGKLAKVLGKSLKADGKAKPKAKAAVKPAVNAKPSAPPAKLKKAAPKTTVKAKTLKPAKKVKKSPRGKRRSKR